MGHSMGGLLAQILGARGLAKALVLLTPASPAGIMALSDQELLEHSNKVGVLENTDAHTIQLCGLLGAAPTAGKRTERNIRKICLCVGEGCVRDRLLALRL